MKVKTQDEDFKVRNLPKDSIDVAFKSGKTANTGWHPDKEDDSWHPDKSIVKK